MRIRESAIERAVTAWAKEHGISTLKISGAGNRGKSDRIFWKGTKVAWCELKATGKLPTPLQLKFLAERNADGFDVGWFDNSPATIAWLKKVFL